MTPQESGRRTYTEIAATLLAISFLAACGSDATATPSAYDLQVQKALAIGNVQLPQNPQYDCFIDAYQQQGEKMMPKPLPSKKGEYGEKVYDLKLSTGRVLPMHVFADGKISYAPGESLAETIEAMGLPEELTFSDVSYSQLREIHVWVFNQSTHLTAEEAIQLAHTFPVTYPVEVNGQTINANMLAKMHNGGTEEQISQNYAEFSQLQYRHPEEINESLVYFLQKGANEALTTDGVCGEYAEGLWQKKINQLATLHQNGEIQIPFQGSQDRFTREGWEEGEWGMVLYVLVDPELAYTGVDPLYMIEGNRISYFKTEDGKEVPSYYPYTRLGEVPLANHELFHGVVGNSEDLADRGALALLHLYLSHWQQGDFRADWVVIDNETDLPVPPPSLSENN